MALNRVRGINRITIPNGLQGWKVDPVSMSDNSIIVRDWEKYIEIAPEISILVEMFSRAGRETARSVTAWLMTSDETWLKRGKLILSIISTCKNHECCIRFPYLENAPERVRFVALTNADMLKLNDDTPCTVIESIEVN
jgi:hypothetical protein